MFVGFIQAYPAPQLNVTPTFTCWILRPTKLYEISFLSSHPPKPRNEMIPQSIRTGLMPVEIQQDNDENVIAVIGLMRHC